jgi:hypothetical protein
MVMANFQTELVKAAKAELVRFGGQHETDPDVHDILKQYWTEGAGFKSKAAETAIADRTAWSAAFISFLVKQALSASGSAASFAFSASHSVYAGAAIRNMMAEEPPEVFYGFPPDGDGAEMPEVGDIFGSTRVLHIDDFADALDAARKHDTYFSHFDVVTDITNGTLTSIGGNVSNSVTEKTVTLTTDGFLPKKPFKFDGAGNVVSGPYICIIKFRR